MKKKILSIVIIMVLGLMLITLTGCGDKNKDNYSEAMNEIRNTKFSALGDFTIGEYIDFALQDAKWTEDNNYSGDRGTGAIKVVGKDKDTGNEVEILWIQEIKNGSEKESNIDYIVIDGKKEDNDAMAYSKYIQYLSKYKSDLESQSE